MQECFRVSVLGQMGSPMLTCRGPCGAQERLGHGRWWRPPEATSGELLHPWGPRTQHAPVLTLAATHAHDLCRRGTGWAPSPSTIQTRCQWSTERHPHTHQHLWSDGFTTPKAPLIKISPGPRSPQGPRSHAHP